LILRVWDTDSATELLALTGHENVIGQIHFFPTNNMVETWQGTMVYGTVTLGTVEGNSFGFMGQWAAPRITLEKSMIRWYGGNSLPSHAN